MIACHDIVNIVDSSWSHSDFSKVSGPNSTVSIFGLILREISWVNMIMNISISLIPFLIIILFEVLMGRMNRKVLADPRDQLQLFIDFVQKYVILFTDHTVTVAAISAKYLKS